MNGGAQGTLDTSNNEVVQGISMNDIKDLLQAAILAALDAGDRILHVYDSEDFQITHKQDETPLTLADREAHAAIASILDRTGIRQLSEEGRDIPYAERKSWDMFWMIDPLDGTKEFIKRNGEFTVNIALIRKAAPVLGVVYIPVTKKLYFAGQTIGAFVYDEQDRRPEAVVRKALPLSVRRRQAPGPKRIFTIVGSRSHSTPELEQFVAEKKREHGEIRFVSAGSSLKFCLMAEGLADLYPRLGPTMEWDTAAGHAVAEHAGCTVVEYESGRHLRYNKENLINPWFIVK